ncbi:accessory Sec-dependent serine-rich glycoprotein adhesin, partial [Ligilactobacillus salivarius]|nr:accessory Sec-dependent serine-rich glycoprotein adhesin [Ligilactobacillus salivarius]
MKFRRNKKDFFEFENDRKTHVKLYKAGKQWVSSLISSIGLIRVFKGKLDKSTMNTQLVSKEKDKKSEDKLSSDGITAALKGAAALGAVAGGTVLTTNTALADTKQLDSNQNLVNKETVNLSSGSGSSSVSDSLSTSESDVQSEASVSKSESVSLNTNSSSTSETKSNSNSSSESISESKSNSQSQASTSQSISRSESLASSSSINNSSNVTSSKAELESMVNQASAFINSSEFKSADVAYQEAYKPAIQYFQAILSDPQSGLTDSDYAYGVQQLQALQQAIKSKETPQPQVFAVGAAQDTQQTATMLENGKGGRYIVGDKYGRIWTDFTTGSPQPHLVASRDTGQGWGYVEANIKVNRETLDNGRDRWTVTFFPEKAFNSGNPGDKGGNGLVNAKFGIGLTSDYNVVSPVKIVVDTDPNDLTFGTEYQRADVEPHKEMEFDPNKDVDAKSGAVTTLNPSATVMNPYLQKVYFVSDEVTPDIFSKTIQAALITEGKTEAGTGIVTDGLNLQGQTARNSSNAVSTNDKVFITNGGKEDSGHYSSNNYHTMMYFKSWGITSGSQRSSFTISFETEHNLQHQANLQVGKDGYQTFSGLTAAVKSYQNAWQNMFSIYEGEEASSRTTPIRVIFKEKYDLGGQSSSEIPQHQYVMRGTNNNKTFDVTNSTVVNGEERNVVDFTDINSKYTAEQINEYFKKILNDSTLPTIEGFKRSITTETKIIDGIQTQVNTFTFTKIDTSRVKDTVQLRTGIGNLQEKIVAFTKNVANQTNQLKSLDGTALSTLNGSDLESIVRQDYYDIVEMKGNIISEINALLATNPRNAEELKVLKQITESMEKVAELTSERLGDIRNLYLTSTKPVRPYVQNNAYNNPKTGDNLANEALQDWMNIYNAYNGTVTQEANRLLGITQNAKGVTVDNASTATRAEYDKAKQRVIDLIQPNQMGNTGATGTYSQIFDALSGLNDAIYNLKDEKEESLSLSTSSSQSMSVSQSLSKSASESLSASTSLSESLSASTSLSESLSASTSLSESLSASTSLSESLSASTSLSESLSASTSLSESLSASTSLSESLSASTSLSESLSASTSLSESLSASTSLSESLSASTSLSESLSASTSLSESLSASTSLSESLSASTSLSESLSASTSLSESLSASTSLSESLSASTSLSESLSASTSLSESLSASTSLSESLSASTSLSESL